MKSFCIFIFTVAITGLYIEDVFCEEIVIEAARLDSERVDPSRSVSVITSDDIDQMHVNSVADVLREVPGIQLTSQGPQGQTTSVFIRGARSEGTLVIVDGVEVNDASSPACGFDFSALSSSNIERIEVYRGPQSVRFGAGAIGGVINIVTKQGEPGLSAGYDLEGGSFGTRRGLIQSSGGSEMLRYSTAIEGFGSDGFSAASGGSEPDRTKITSASGKVSWIGSSTTGVFASFRHTQADVDIDRGGGAASDDPNNESMSEQFSASLQARSRFINDALKLNAGVYTAETVRELSNRPDDNDTTDSQNQFYGRNFKARVGGDFLIGEPHTLRFSLDNRTELAHSNSEFTGGSSSVPEESQSVTGGGLTYLFEDREYFADLGARIDQSTTIGEVESYRASVGRNILASGTKVTLAYGTGYKLPSLFQLFSSFGDENLDSEMATSFDFMIEQRVSQRSAFIFTVFETRYSNMIDFNLATNRYFNVAAAVSRGVDLAFKGRFNELYSFDGNYSYLETEDRSTGLGLVRRPYNSFNGSLTRHFDNYSVSVLNRFRDDRPDIDPVSFERVNNPSYLVWGLNTSVTLSPTLRVNARIDNLFNENYEEVAGYATPDRSFFVGLSGEI